MEQSIITVNGRALREGSIIAAEVPRNTKYGGTIWTCYEVVHNKNSSIPFIADIIGNVCQEDDWLVMGCIDLKSFTGNFVVVKY